MTTKGLKTVAADEKIERFYQTMVKHMLRECERDKSLRNLEIIATLGRMTGYCIAACHPMERDLVRQIAIENIDRATKDVAQP